ncbi:hypothetical protein M3Y95_00456300 [Aphelenchoides besseyi]|nr:hypothetical protein M3Y95_00456300 [Aphelenchoides besseyi]
MAKGRKQHTLLKDIIWPTLAWSTSTVVGIPFNRDAVQPPPNYDSMSQVERMLYGQQNLVHTFGTPDSCARNCPRQCINQEVEDLLSVRWICPSKGSITSELSPISPIIRGDRAVSNDFFPFSSQMFLILIPAFLIFVCFILILWKRCVSNSSID